MKYDRSLFTVWHGVLRQVYYSIRIVHLLTPFIWPENDDRPLFFAKNNFSNLLLFFTISVQKWLMKLFGHTFRTGKKSAVLRSVRVMAYSYQLIFSKKFSSFLNFKYFHFDHECSRLKIFSGVKTGNINTARSNLHTKLNHVWP